MFWWAFAGDDWATRVNPQEWDLVILYKGLKIAQSSLPSCEGIAGAHIHECEHGPSLGMNSAGTLILDILASRNKREEFPWIIYLYCKSVVLYFSIQN